MLALVFLSVCMDSCACACVSQCLYGLLYLRLCFSVFVWTRALAHAFLGLNSQILPTLPSKTPTTVLIQGPSEMPLSE